MRGLAALSAALLIAGCSNAPDKEAAAKPPPTVGLQTTCDRLFTQGDPRLWSRATTLVAAESNGQSIDQGEVDTVARELKEIGASSKPVIRPHIATMRMAVADLDDLDTSAYKTGATEVANQCTPYVAVN